MMEKLQGVLLRKNNLFFILVFIVIIILIPLLVFTKKDTLSPDEELETKTSDPLVALVNIEESKQSLNELAQKIQDSSQSNDNTQKAQIVLNRALGTGSFTLDVSNFSRDLLLSKVTYPQAGLIPMGSRLIELCKQSTNSSCKTDIKKVNEKIDMAQRLVKFYAILAHVPDLCVKADLGTKPHINATTIHGNTSRLYICTGAPGDIKFRAPAKNGKFVRVKESFTTGVSNNALVKANTCVFKIPITVSCN